MKNRDARDLAEAKDRVARAKRYAELFPKFIHADDLKFQTLEWQLKQLQGWAEKACPQKE